VNERRGYAPRQKWGEKMQTKCLAVSTYGPVMAAAGVIKQNRKEQNTLTILKPGKEHVAQITLTGAAMDELYALLDEFYREQGGAANE
jgi:hypothetical protein